MCPHVDRRKGLRMEWKCRVQGIDGELILEST